MRAGPVTRFPLLNTDLATHVEAMLLLAEVRAACSGDAVVITEAIVGEATRAVHLSGADPHIFIGHACNECLSTKCEGEDTGTAGVRSRHGVAAGAGRLCTDAATRTELVIVRAASEAGLPELKADLSAHVEAKLLFAKIWPSHSGSAVIIAEAIVCK